MTKLWRLLSLLLSFFVSADSQREQRRLSANPKIITIGQLSFSLYESSPILLTSEKIIFDIKLSSDVYLSFVSVKDYNSVKAVCAIYEEVELADPQLGRVIEKRIERTMNNEFSATINEIYLLKNERFLLTFEQAVRSARRPNFMLVKIQFVSLPRTATAKIKH